MRRTAVLFAAVVLLGTTMLAAPARASSTRAGTIAFVREGDERGLWLVQADGAETRLTQGQDYRPDWSPDGRWIVFQRFKGGGSDIYVVRADGSHLRALTEDGDNYHPSWSPDGERIAFGHGQGREGEIGIAWRSSSGSATAGSGANIDPRADEYVRRVPARAAS